MGNLTLSINVTLDGCCDHTEVMADEELHHYAINLVEKSDGLLFGRVTYELFERYWPSVAAAGTGTKAEIDLARKLNDKRKYVVSNTLGKVAWENSFLIKGDLADEIPKLKQGDGNDLVLFGSPGLASSLALLGLIDEFQFLVQPMVAGRGPRLFQGIGRKLDLTLLWTGSFRSGVVLLCYAPPQEMRAGQANGE